MHVRTATFDNTRGDASVEVVGEQYRAEAVERFRRFAAGVSANALLMREPANPRDGNAIAVFVWTTADPPQAEQVGYLTREDAPRYRPIFDRLGDVAIMCEAAIAPYRGGAGADGVVLHLGTPGELIAEIWASEHPFGEHPYRGKSVAFTGFGLSLAGAVLDREGQTLLARTAGVVAAPRVTKKVDACVCHGGEETSATARARQYGIPIIDESAFWVALGIPEDQLSRGVGRWAQPRERAWR